MRLQEQAKEATATALLASVVRAARLAGEVIGAATASRKSIRWEKKGTADFVSSVDREAETRIRNSLLSDWPSCRIVGEEFSPEDVPRDGLTFIADPLDGTTNFLHGYPEYAVSIGALEDGEPVAGVILNAATGDLYSAALGGGAFRNGEPLHVSVIDDPALALIGTGFPFKEIGVLPLYLRQFDAVTRGTSGIRRAGAAALDLASVAAGEFDAFWELGLAPWDVAAGLLIIREAGGVVTDLDGNRASASHGAFVAGNLAIHGWLLDTLRSAPRSDNKR